MSYKLYLDDLRDCPEGFILARSSKDAITIVEIRGMPEFISLDHDLGNDDISMVFLKWLSNNFDKPSFEYIVHSANPVGALNIISFIESWKKASNLD
jgi:hypothetical protein